MDDRLTDEEIKQSQLTPEEKKERATGTAEAATGGALAGLGCLWFALLPFSFIILCILILWLIGAFTSS